MNRLIYFMMIAMIPALSSPVMAQIMPVDRLTQFSGVLTPSQAQEFFRAGHTQMEQEIRRLQQRGADLANLLPVKTPPQARDLKNRPLISPPTSPPKS